MGRSEVFCLKDSTEAIKIPDVDPLALILLILLSNNYKWQLPLVHRHVCLLNHSTRLVMINNSFCLLPTTITRARDSYR